MLDPCFKKINLLLPFPYHLSLMINNVPCRHLIGFFLFLSLTICTAIKVPKVIDLHSLQLPDMLKADLHKLQECLPSLPTLPNIPRLREEIKATLPSMDLLPSLPGWHIMELLYNCLPERFSSGNHTNVCVLVMLFFFDAFEILVILYLTV